MGRVGDSNLGASPARDAAGVAQRITLAGLTSNTGDLGTPTAAAARRDIDDPAGAGDVGAIGDVCDAGDIGDAGDVGGAGDVGNVGDAGNAAQRAATIAFLACACAGTDPV